MAVDWLARLREQGTFAKRMAREVPIALSDSRLTLQEAGQLYQTVDNCARSFDAIVREMAQAGADKSFFHAAETVAGLWLDLSHLAANRVEALQERDAGPRRAVR